MAEGDTIVRAARRIESALGGGGRLRVTAPSPRGRAARVERLDGRELEAVEARGKHLLLRFSGPASESIPPAEGLSGAGGGARRCLVLHSHLGMSGSWHVYRRGAVWRKPARGAWVALQGNESEAVQFGGPTLRVLTATAALRDPQLARLGPDILAEGFDSAAVTRSLRTSPDLNVGEALLDQSRVAGIGNIFKSEACFAAKLSPWALVGQLSDDELERVLSCARSQMRESVVSGQRPGAVYRRRGQPCLACRTPISSRGQGDANRTSYWCPSCQPTLGFQLSKRGNEAP